MFSGVRGCLTALRHIFWWILVLPLAAQTNEEVFREYQFNFNLPGARANGMGGAFIGLADDATSSYTNPAGLAFLSETGVTLNWRNQKINGDEGDISGFFNARYEVAPRDLSQAAFFSLNLNYRGWFFGIFQHQFVNEEQTRTFDSRSISNGVENIELRDISLDLEGLTHGLGIARRFGDFKLGVTFNYLTLDALTHYQRSTFVIQDTFDTIDYTSSINSSDSQWGYTLGLLHETGTRFSWGLVWRANPGLALEEDVLEELNGQPILVDNDVRVPFVVPDVFGAGMRLKPRQDLSLLLDWQRILYSQILGKDGLVIVESAEQNSKSDYAIKDSDEVHLGAEWLIPGESTVWALRGGYYHNPVHAVTYHGEDRATRDRFAQIGLFNENHYTVGAGWVFRNVLEIDLSANFWETGHEIQASFIWRKK